MKNSDKKETNILIKADMPKLLTIMKELCPYSNGLNTMKKTIPKKHFPTLLHSNQLNHQKIFLLIMIPKFTLIWKTQNNKMRIFLIKMNNLIKWELNINNFLSSIPTETSNFAMVNKWKMLLILIWENL